MMAKWDFEPGLLIVAPDGHWIVGHKGVKDEPIM